MKRNLGLLVSLFAFSLLTPKMVYAGDVYQVCHGELDSVCAEHPYTYHEQCSQPPGTVGGISPVATTIFLCGSKKGGVPKGSYTNLAPGHDGNNCGYAWITVTCDDDN
jgi:hypothetical protein